MSGTRSPWYSGTYDLLMAVEGDMAKSDETWSNSGGGDSETIGDANDNDEVD